MQDKERVILRVCSGLFVLTSEHDRYFKREEGHKIYSTSYVYRKKDMERCGRILLKDGHMNMVDSFCGVMSARMFGINCKARTHVEGKGMYML